MLKLVNIHKRFSNGADVVHALNGINLEIHAGTFTVVIGANGSGKSTLLNTIAGSIQPDEGQILLNEKRIDKFTDYRRAKYISRIFQDPGHGTAPDLSIIENFRLAFLRKKKRTLISGINTEFKKMIARRIEALGLGLENKLNQPVGQLSGGQRQALALLMAIIEPPDLLLLDEPTAALDPKAAKLVLKIANQFIQTENLTTLFVTHNMQDAIKFGNRLIQMDEGQIKRDLDEKEKSKLDLMTMVEWFDEG